MESATILNEFQRIERFLFDPTNWKPVLLTREWAKLKPKDAGVYMLFENGKPVYVGESGSISGRISDMLDSRHHTVRRALGEMRFSMITGYAKASSKSKHPEHIETLIVQTMQGFNLSVLPIKIGRKEFEEYIFEKYNPELNRKAKRGS